MPIRPLSKTLQSMAEEQLNEVPSEIQEKLEHIRAWISKQPHLKCRLDDQWLLTFLRGSKFSLQKTKAKLEAYYSARSILPEFFSNRDPFAPEVAEYFKRCIVMQYSLPAEEESPLPMLTIIRFKNYDADLLPFEVAVKIGLLVADLTLCTDDRFVIAGEHLLIDVQEWNSSMLTQFTLVNMKKAVHLSHIAYPIRLRGLYFINVSALFSLFFNTIKSLIPKKILSKIHMYKEGELEELYKAIPKSVLPVEYGGNAATMEELSAQMLMKVQMYNEWFAEDKNYGTEESKRIEPLCDYGMFQYGPEGSFRQLTVD